MAHSGVLYILSDGAPNVVGPRYLTFLSSLLRRACRPL